MKKADFINLQLLITTSGPNIICFETNSKAVLHEVMDPSNPMFPEIVWQNNDVLSREELRYDQAILESSEMEINNLFKFYGKTKEKALNMKKLENEATSETKIAAEENELRKEVEKLFKTIENDKVCSAFLLKQSRKMGDIFAEARTLITAKRTETFVTTYKSYRDEYDRLRKQFEFDHPRSMKMSVIEREVQLAAIKTNIFNLWKMIETGKLIVEGIDEITRQRRKKIREIIIQESISRLNWSLLRREEISRVHELCLNFGVRYVSLNVSHDNNDTPPVSKKRKLEENPEPVTNTGENTIASVGGVDEKGKLETSGFLSSEQTVAASTGSPVEEDSPGPPSLRSPFFPSQLATNQGITNEQLLQLLICWKQMPQQPLDVNLSVFEDNATNDLKLGTNFF